MSSIACRVGGVMHSHDSVEDVRACARSQSVTPVTAPRAIVPPAAPVRTASTWPVRAGNTVTIREPEAPPTPAQVRYIEALGADMRAVGLMNKGQVSDYISAIKGGTASNIAATPPSVPVAAPVPIPAYRHSPELSDAAKAMLATIEDGYYAWQPDSATPLVFVRIRERKGRASRLHGSRVIASQHSEAFTDEAFAFPSGRTGYLRLDSRYGSRTAAGYQHRIQGSDITLDDAILGIAVNKFQAARDYALQKGRCCRCHKELTDERSRWYGIGPICDKVWTWYIEGVDNEKGCTFEERP